MQHVLFPYFYFFTRFCFSVPFSSICLFFIWPIYCSLSHTHTHLNLTLVVPFFLTHFFIFVFGQFLHDACSILRPPSHSPNNSFFYFSQTVSIQDNLFNSMIKILCKRKDPLDLTLLATLTKKKN